MKIRSIRPTAKIKRKKPPVKIHASATRAASRRAVVEDYDEEEEYYESSEPNMKLSHAFIVVLILHLIAVAGIFGFNAMKSRQSTLERIARETTAPAVIAETGVTEGATNAPALAPAPAPSAAASPARTHQIVPGDTLTKISSQYGVTIEAIEATNNLGAESVLRVGQVLEIPAPGTQVSAAPRSSTPPAPVPAAKTNVAAQTATATPVIPAANPATTKPAPNPVSAASSLPSTAGVEVYEVVAGDNPYSIAKRLEVSYQALIELNNITDPTKLQIGQKLKIPASR